LRLEGLEERITPAVIFSENFDGVVAGALPPGWTASHPTGSPTLWTTANSGLAAPAPSAPNAAFAPDFNNIGDNLLDSPTVAINGANGIISFQLKFDLEPGFDGGQLLISINSGAFQEFTAAGGSFTAGGYTATIPSFFGSPIGGQPAWSGNSGGYITVTANLPAATMPGSTVRFRWRVATDNAIGSPTFAGMAINDVQVTIPPQSDLAVAITDGVAQVVAGSPVNYIVTLTNNGPDAVSTATLFDALPAGLTAVTFTPSVGSYNPITGVWTGLALAAGQHATLTAHGTVAPGSAGPLTNQVSVLPPFGVADPNVANNLRADTDVVLQPGPGPALRTLISLLSVNPQLLRGFNFTFADVTGDKVTDLIVSGGAGKPALVSVVDGQSGQLARTILAFPGFNGGVRVSVADINGDGIADIITSAAVPRKPRIKVFNGPTGALILSL
jgi:uncharacterized repeat protein (TIGR01451 family)